MKDLWAGNIMKSTEYDTLIQKIVEDNKKLKTKNIKSIYINKFGLLNDTKNELFFKVGQKTNLKDGFGRCVYINQIKIHIGCDPKNKKYAMIGFTIDVIGKQDKDNHHIIYEFINVETCYYQLMQYVHCGIIFEDDSKLTLCYSSHYNA